MDTFRNLSDWVSGYYSGKSPATKLRRAFKFSEKECGIGRKFSSKKDNLYDL
jgi:hypothetical protein